MQHDEHKAIGTHVRGETDGKGDINVSEAEQKNIGTHIWSEADGKVDKSVELGSAPKLMPVEIASEALPSKDGKIGVSKPVGTHTWCEADGKAEHKRRVEGKQRGSDDSLQSSTDEKSRQSLAPQQAP